MRRRKERGERTSSSDFFASGCVPSRCPRVVSPLDFSLCFLTFVSFVPRCVLPLSDPLLVLRTTLLFVSPFVPPTPGVLRKSFPFLVPLFFSFFGVSASLFLAPALLVNCAYARPSATAPRCPPSRIARTAIRSTLSSETRQPGFLEPFPGALG